MTNDQCRSARALLGLTQPELAKVARSSVTTLQAFEAGREQLSPKVMSKFRRAFVSLGIEFLNDEDGVGLRRRRTLNEIAAAPSEPSGPEDAEKGASPGLPNQAGRITPEQCRAARGFLGLSQLQAAAELEVGLSTLVSFEHHKAVPGHRIRSAMKSGFEARGLIFSDSGGVHWVGRRPGEEELSHSALALKTLG